MVITLVDDDPLLLRLLTVYLEEEYVVHAFISAVEALAYLRINPTDLVVSDINMPDMDGFSLRRCLAEESEAGLMPFLFLTGDQDELTRSQANELGADDFLVKPICKDSLLDAVNQVLNPTKSK